MFLFQEQPDPIFLAIFREALEYVREVQLVQFREGHQPTQSQRKELDEFYETLYPELGPFFSRGQLIRVIDRLLEAGRKPELYRLTDYHWMVIYRCLETYCDLHNDGATGTHGKVGTPISSGAPCCSRPRRRRLAGSRSPRRPGGSPRV